MAIRRNGQGQQNDQDSGLELHFAFRTGGGSDLIKTRINKSLSLWEQNCPKSHGPYGPPPRMKKERAMPIARERYRLNLRRMPEDVGDR